MPSLYRAGILMDRVQAQWLPARLSAVTSAAAALTFLCRIAAVALMWATTSGSRQTTSGEEGYGYYMVLPGRDHS